MQGVVSVVCLPHSPLQVPAVGQGSLKPIQKLLQGSWWCVSWYPLSTRCLAPWGHTDVHVIGKLSQKRWHAVCTCLRLPRGFLGARPERLSPRGHTAACPAALLGSVIPASSPPRRQECGSQHKCTLSTMSPSAKWSLGAANPTRRLTVTQQQHRSWTPTLPPDSKKNHTRRVNLNYLICTDQEKELE